MTPHQEKMQRKKIRNQTMTTGFQMVEDKKFAPLRLLLRSRGEFPRLAMGNHPRPSKNDDLAYRKGSR
jgi:hypothetical protein